MSESHQANLKKVLIKRKMQGEHWVGDGFFVSTIFSAHQGDSNLISPFLLMDHSAPREFKPQRSRRGVGEHPHRGFETVTFAYSGEVEHRDSGGGGGTIGAGDVQWMTAGSGVVHEEKHSQAFTEAGGFFEMVQLWVNLPAKLKMVKPRYQALLDREFPRWQSKDKGNEARLIAGQLQDQKGPALTYSPMNVLDVTFNKDSEFEAWLPKDWTTLIFVMRGEVKVTEGEILQTRDFAVLDPKTEGLKVSGKANSKILILNGEPFQEPVVAHGPFVMNSIQEIQQAIEDYQNGRMGHLE